MPPIGPSKRVFKKKPKKKKAPPVSVRPQTKTPAAPSKPTPSVRPQTKTPAAPSRPVATAKPGRPMQRGHASEGGKTIRTRTVRKIRREQERANRGKTEAAFATSDDFPRAEAFKRTDEYLLALRAARKAGYEQMNAEQKKKAFGNPREDAKNPAVLARFKAEDDRVAEINRKKLRETIDRELSGEGKVAKAVARIADEATKPRGKDGKGRSLAAAVIPGLGVQPKKLREFSERGIEDLINAPAAAVPSLYVPAAGAVEAAHGRPQRLKKFAEDVKQTDPIYNTVAAGVATVKGDSKAAKSHIRKAGKSVSEHPGFAALEVAGAKGSFGRGLGKTARSGVVGKRAKRAASVRRAPATVPGTRIVQEREFSPDVIKKGRQALQEKRQIKRAEKTRAQARKTDDPDAKVELLRTANRQDPRIASSREIRRRVDEREDVNEGARRIHRTQAVVDTRKIVKKVRRKDRAAISVVAQNITKASKKDIQAYVNELKTEHAGLDKAGQRANARLQRDLQRIVDDPKADLGKVQGAARAYEKLTAPLQDKLVKSGLLAGGRADKAKLIPYAVRNMGAKVDEALGTVTESGIPISASEIRVHMAGYREEMRPVERVETLANHAKPRRGRNQAQENMLRELAGTVPAPRTIVRKGSEKVSTHHPELAVGEPAFLSQSPNQRGAKNFNISAGRAQSISSRRRTGGATLKGTWDAHPDTLKENAARAQGLVDATDGFRGYVEELGHRTGDTLNTYKNRKDADGAKANLEAEFGERFRAIRLNPFDGPPEQLQALLDDVNSDNQLAASAHGEKSPVVQALEDALKGKGDNGAWALIPEAGASQMLKHLNAMGSTGSAGKVGQMVNSNFRKTVLTTSVPWATGNVVEASFRTAVAKAGPLSYLTARKAMKNLSDEDLLAAEQVALRTIGGGHFGAADRQHVRRDAEQFRDTGLEGTAQALGKFWRTPGPKHAAAAWHIYTQFVMENMRRVESQFQTAMLGKAIRDSELFDDKIVGLSKKAMDDVRQGLKDTNNVVALGRKVDRMYGKYSKDSPEMRFAKAYYTPFIAWSLNAVKFIVDVLPRDHPTAMALTISAERATEDWRKDHGLDMFMEKAVPGWLMGSIPVAGGSQRSPNRYLPFAAFGDPLATASGQVLPQFMGPILAGMGLDWTGSPINGMGGGAPDQGQKAKAVGEAFLGGQVPFYSLGLRVADKGVAGAMDPFAVTSPAKGKKKLRRVSDPWSDAGSSGIKWSDDTSGGISWPD